MRERKPLPVLNLGLPDQFVEHGSREQILAGCGLDEHGIVRAINEYCGESRN
jgi:1-deoxy-D-xylulose-5-phosphate synthase